MPEQLLFALTLVAAVGSGLWAGVFFAFSTFVMKGLARLPAEQGIAAMQSINVAVTNPFFMVAFLGTPAACILAMILSLSRWQQLAMAHVLAGGALYLAGVFLMTIVYHVPKNNALASIGATDPGAAEFWADYCSKWTTWNHVRTVTALAAAVLLTIALSHLS